MQDYSIELAMTVTEYLKEDGWNYTFDEKNGMIHASVALQSALAMSGFLIDLNQDFYQIYARVFVDLGPEQAPAMAVLLNELNCRITFGHFEFGENGSLRYRLTVPFETMPGEKMLHNSFYLPACLLDHYADEMLAVLQNPSEKA